MRVCLMVEGQESVSWEEWLALARVSEEAGLAGLFRSDHYASTLGGDVRGGLDAWTTLAALAVATERIRLGTLVSPVTFRLPGVLARNVVTVDHVSGGRVELGLGAGWLEAEHVSNGIPFPELETRLSMLREQLELVVRQWTEDGWSFSGAHYRLEGSQAVPKPVQQPRPPLIVGGSGARGTVEPAVRWADEYDTIFKTVDEIRTLRAKLDRACEAAGRDPLRLSLMTTTVVGADEAELVERARRTLARIGRDAEPEAWVRERRAGPALVGTVEQVVARLHEYAEVGLDGVYLQHLDHTDLDAVRLIGAEVVPALA